MKTTTQALDVGEVPTSPGIIAKLIREVRAQTRRRFSAEDKIRVVLEGFRKEMPVSDLCRREGISSPLYYSCLKDFMEAGKARLKGDTLRDATLGEVKRLRYSQKILTCELEHDETALVLSNVLKLGLENLRKEGLTETDPMPKLYSDNGSGFTSKILAEYLSVHGIKHIFAGLIILRGEAKLRALTAGSRRRSV